MDKKILLLDLFFNQAICNFDGDTVKILTVDYVTVPNFNSRDGYYETSVLSECETQVKLKDIFTHKELKMLRSNEFYECVVERPNADSSMALKYIGAVK